MPCRVTEKNSLHSDSFQLPQIEVRRFRQGAKNPRRVLQIGAEGVFAAVFPADFRRFAGREQEARHFFHFAAGYGFGDPVQSRKNLPPLCGVCAVRQGVCGGLRAPFGGGLDGFKAPQQGGNSFRITSRPAADRFGREKITFQPGNGRVKAAVYLFPAIRQGKEFFRLRRLQPRNGKAAWGQAPVTRLRIPAEAVFKPGGVQREPPVGEYLAAVVCGGEEGEASAQGAEQPGFGGAAAVCFREGAVLEQGAPEMGFEARKSQVKSGDPDFLCAQDPGKIPGGGRHRAPRAQKPFGVHLLFDETSQGKQ
jgi:hypothetical protein